jgi:hypothetical protein
VALIDLFTGNRSNKRFPSAAIFENENIQPIYNLSVYLQVGCGGGFSSEKNYASTICGLASFNSLNK